MLPSSKCSFSKYDFRFQIFLFNKSLKILNFSKFRFIPIEEDKYVVQALDRINRIHTQIL